MDLAGPQVAENANRGHVAFDMFLFAKTAALFFIQPSVSSDRVRRTHAPRDARPSSRPRLDLSPSTHRASPHTAPSFQATRRVTDTMKSAVRVFARVAIVALVAALVTTGAVAQEDAAPSQAHLIVHKVRLSMSTLAMRSSGSRPSSRYLARAHLS